MIGYALFPNEGRNNLQIFCISKLEMEQWSPHLLPLISSAFILTVQRVTFKLDLILNVICFFIIIIIIIVHYAAANSLAGLGIN